MKIGISANPLFHANGQPKFYDGLGSFTKMLMTGLQPEHTLRPVVVQTPLKSLMSAFSAPKALSSADLTILPHPLIQLLSPVTLPAYHQYESSIDLYHSTDYLTPRFNHIPVFSTIQDAIMFHPNWQKKTLKHRFGPYLLKRFSQHADHIISPSYAIIPDLLSLWGIPEQKISVIPHGIDPLWLSPLTDTIEAVRTRYTLTKKPYFLVVGTLQPRKNIERILQAYRTSSSSFRKNYTILFVGKLGFLEAPTLSLIQHMHEQKEIQWLQYLPLEVLRILYHYAEAILFPSLAEGFGYPILEGFASRRPVITSNLGCMAEVAGDAALCVDPTSIDSIQQGMMESTLQTTATSLIQRGWERLALYSAEKHFDSTIKLYKKFL